MFERSDSLCRLERMEQVAGSDDAHYGKPVFIDRDCCGKPEGCCNPSESCAYQNHPFKVWAREEMARKKMESLKREGLLRAR